MRQRLHREREPIYAELADVIVPAVRACQMEPIVPAFRDIPGDTKLLWAATASGDSAVGSSSPGSPITVGLKDAGLIQAAAALAEVPLPGFNVYRDRLLGAVAHGDGGKDQAALAREQARACGLE